MIPDNLIKKQSALEKSDAEEAVINCVNRRPTVYPRHGVEDLARCHLCLGCGRSHFGCLDTLFVRAATCRVLMTVFIEAFLNTEPLRMYC